MLAAEVVILAFVASFLFYIYASKRRIFTPLIVGQTSKAYPLLLRRWYTLSWRLADYYSLRIY